MSKKSRLLTMTVCRRKICAALPAFVLIGGSIALTAHAEPVNGATVSNGFPAIVVPDVALAPPSVLGTPGISSALPTPASTDPLAEPKPLTPALVLPEGTVPGSSTPVTLDRAGIPVLALESYRTAVSLINAADPGCNIDWALVAAIGRVESDHARFGGNQLDSGGVARPGIIGIPLDGSNGTARITDSDGGLLDRDTVFDRAVGPMQFIPSTWRFAGADADGDGVKNPQDMTDAAAAAAIYLCSGPGDLTQPADLHSAIMRYNASESYVKTVIAIADAYRSGVIALPASDLPASDPPDSALSAADRSAPTMALTAKAIALTARVTTGRPSPTTLPRPQPASRPVGVKPGAPATTGAVPASPPAVPAAPVAAAPEPATPVAAAPEPPAPVPATSEPATPVAAAPEPATPDPATPPAETTTPAVPAPCLATPTQPCPQVPCPITPAPTTPDPTIPDPTIPGEPASEPPCLPPCLPAADGTTAAPTTPCLTPPAGTVPGTPIAPELCSTTPPGIENCTVVP